MTAAKVLAAAQAELGTRESPANSNNVKYNTWYYGRAVSGSAYPWCMVFIMWLFYKLGALHLLPARTASCGTLMRAAQKAGMWVTGEYRPGDVVIYDFPGGAATDHTGIVESVTKTGVIAIEGNTSESGSQSNGGQVCRKTRPYSQVVGAVRPKYEEKDMDFSKWKDEDFIRFAERMQTALAKKPVSAKLAQELQEAKDRGITDGSKPGAFVTRAQAAVMALRATR